MQKLVKTRNETLNVSLKWRNVYNNSDSFDSYTKSDFKQQLELGDKVRKTEMFNSLHSLFDIPIKDHNEEFYKEGELTEEENKE
mmetsp:Transcript_21265/g.23670  ORF Transcript_21265/g.23670 Transcript_21265/m.23670 type:complete len:84 (+) Transcript_21265:613-864(+)